ncbi:MAG: ATP-binding cassette domain-containing protein [Defluviitaleaceae bacterium]|nr:ATP-binding cassette domain-containing protein [Defluviitaleaceae bacterium]
MEHIISATNLQKSFKDNRVLKGVSFGIPKGSIFALLGSNGAGKTTAVRILSTLLKPDGGSAAICGYDVIRQADYVRGCISLTGQFAAVDEVLTGRENLQTIGALNRLPNVNKKADELLATFRLEDAANRKVSTYSGGMRRRLDIAMSLAGNPAVIFLDEPTTGLDPQNRIAMWDMVKGLAEKGTTIFLTTQYLEEAEYLADHIAILHEGVIAAEGTPDELKTILPQGGIRLAFHNCADAKKAKELLKDYRTSRGRDGEGGEPVKNTIDVSTDGSASQFAHVLTTLNDANIPIAHFTQKQPSLEDVFLTLIGEKKEAK